jgi:F-type H+-transporting ATPase subunit b
VLIDWFTVGAQALNFVILVWLMKRFLYKPVLDAIDAREKRIAAELADADKATAAAKQERDELGNKNNAFDRERAALLSKATEDANAERQKLLDAARQAADALAASRRETMASDARDLSRALRQRTQAEVFAVARQALTDLASASLEASACEVFIVRLRTLEGTARDELAAALKSTGDGALVRTAFELPAVQRSALQEAVDETFAMKIGLRYETAPDLVGGIELSVHGHKFAWSISDYLGSLERGVDDLLKPPAAPDRTATVEQAKASATDKPAPQPEPALAMSPA